MLQCKQHFIRGRDRDELILLLLSPSSYRVMRSPVNESKMAAEKDQVPYSNGRGCVWGRNVYILGLDGNTHFLVG